MCLKIQYNTMLLGNSFNIQTHIISKSINFIKKKKKNVYIILSLNKTTFLSFSLLFLNNIHFSNGSPAVWLK